ncbi:MAG: class I SAM-dependent methyltransferase [Isosphaeraceae bacterium]
MNGPSQADEEAWVLTSEPGAALLGEVASVAIPGPSDLARWRNVASSEQVSAAIRLAAGRRRGAAKFSRADSMWFEPTGLEQSTSESVAAHKARRFAGQGRVVVDLCCGIGGDTLALAAGANVLAVDASDGMVRRTRWNAEVYQVAQRVLTVRALAESFGIPSGAWVHIDPDRRAGGEPRARDLAGYVPDLDFLQSLIHTVPAGAIKLGPASDFDSYFDEESLEVELISLKGECKEATLWFGQLARCRRRATRLPEGATWSDVDGSTLAAASLGPVKTWVYDPDPALTRSGLLGGFALAHGLSRYAAGIDFLTGPDLIVSPFLAAFEVLAVLPFDLRTLKREVARRKLGPLEVKTRRMDRRPEEIRARLSPPGPHPGTLLLSGGEGRALAVLARRNLS